MSDKKAIKREAKSIWTAVRDSRRTRAKLFGAQELAESAEILTAYVQDFEELAKRARVEEAAISPDTPVPKVRRKKPKTASEA